jgi:hypothetical protein
MNCETESSDHITNEMFVNTQWETEYNLNACNATKGDNTEI